MYHIIEDQEKHPENYILKEVDLGVVEDECFDLISKPRQTQRTIGLYLKKIKDSKGSAESPPEDEEQGKTKKEKTKFPLTPGNHNLEKKVERNRCFWVERPELAALLLNKIKENFSVEVPSKENKLGQGIFYRPKTLELDYLMKLAQAGKLYPDEELSDSEEETELDNTDCLPLRKIKYKICDPCKEEKPKKEEPVLGPPKDVIEEMMREGQKPPFKKIPTGCQCDYYNEHNHTPTVWDTPFKDKVDMLRQHEMNKWLKPYKHELLNKYYNEHPPVKFMAHEPGMKKTFPIFQISNL